MTQPVTYVDTGSPATMAARWWWSRSRCPESVPAAI
jgi:hypothetical protein